MKTNLLLILGLVFIYSCGTGNSESADSDSTKVEPVVDLNPVFVEPHDLPIECKYEGEVFDVQSWQDLNGKNYFIRTVSEKQEDSTFNNEAGDWPTSSQSLFAYHYVGNDKDHFRRISTISYAIKNCEFDLIMSHIIESFGLTDLNKNDIAEVTFMCRKTCTSDVSPSDQLLLMLENGKEYALEGFSEVFGEGGTYEVSKEFNSAPEGFLEHAKSVWAIYSGEIL